MKPISRETVAVLVMLPMLLMLPSALFAGALEGKWRFDRDRTIAFNKAHGALTPSEEELFKCAELGLEFKKGLAKASQNFSGCKAIADLKQGAPATDHWKYKVIVDTGDEVVTKAFRMDGRISVEQIHLINHDLIWFYYGGEAPEFGEHIRYYYNRER